MNEHCLKKWIFGLYFLIYFLWKSFAPQTINDLGSNVILLLGILFTAVMTYISSRKAGDYRGNLLILSISLFLYFFGDLSWVLYELITNQEVPIEHVSTVFYIFESVLIGVFIWNLILKKSTRWSRIYYGVDGFFLIIFIFFILWKLIFRNIDTDLLGNNLETDVLFLYIGIDFFVILGASILINLKNGNSSDKVIAVALFIWSAADVFYYWLFLTKSYTDSSIVDILWVFSFFIMCYASEYRVCTNNVKIEDASHFENIENLNTQTPLTLTVLFFIALVLSYEEIFVVIIFTLIILFRGIVAKFIYTYIVNEHLTEEYRKLNEMLEEKVVERTEELKAKNEELYILANIDPLTGLPNRRHFLEYLEYRINMTVDNNLFALLFIDLDRFKSINDWYGHEIGDRLLLSVSDRLKKTLPKDSFIARLGGDEFVVIVNNIISEDDAIESAMNFVKAFRTYFRIGDFKINSTISIGISLYPINGDNISQILKTADTALYAAKESGKNTAIMYNNDMRKEERLKLEFESRLYDSIKNNELEIEYRPQMNPIDKSIIGIDARIYWDSKFGRIDYDEFKMIAEDSGFIMDIGIWFIEKICEKIKFFKDKSNLDLKFSLEISTNQFLGSDISALFGEYIRKYGINGNLIEVEIIENFSEKDEELIIEKLNSLKLLGIQISIIDFGKGYSSFKYLNEYPVDSIKIPDSIIDNILIDTNAQNLVKAVSSVSKIFELKSKAQGVKSLEQIELLRELGCDEVTGSCGVEFVSFERIKEMVGI